MTLHQLLDDRPDWRAHRERVDELARINVANKSHIDKLMVPYHEAHDAWIVADREAVSRGEPSPPEPVAPSLSPALLSWPHEHIRRHQQLAEDERRLLADLRGEVLTDVEERERALLTALGPALHGILDETIGELADLRDVVAKLGVTGVPKIEAGPVVTAAFTGGRVLAPHVDVAPLTRTRVADVEAREIRRAPADPADVAAVREALADREQSRRARVGRI